MSKLILITRPAEGATPMAEALQARGHTTLIEPMLVLHPMPQNAMPVLEAAMGHRLRGCIVTSRHALPSLLHYTELRNVPLFVVGNGTADAAMRNGFTNIIKAPDVHLLLRRILATCKPEDGLLLYARGRHVAFNICAVLNRQGFTVEEAITYHMTSAKAFSPQLKEALTSHTLFAATFMSNRTAEVFHALVQDTPLLAELGHVRAIAFSEHVAGVLKTKPWRNIAVCAHATLESLLDTVDKSVAEG